MISLDRNSWEELEKGISLYQSKQEPEVMERLWGEISEYICNYPRIAFWQPDEDVGSEFYLYMWERRENLFKKFDSTQGSFCNFLSLYLRSHYLNFSLRNQKSWSRYRVVYSDQEDFFQESAETENSWSKETEVSESSQKHQLEVNAIFPDYDKNPLNYLVLKLHYLDFFTEDDFVLLKDFTGKKYTELLEKFDQLRDEVASKKRRRLRMHEKLGALYFDVLNQQEKFRDDGYNSTKEEKLNEARRRVLQEYHRISEFASFKGIAQVLGVAETKVANIIVYQRKVMEKKLYGVKNFI